MDFSVIGLDRSQLAYVREQLALHAKARRLLGELLGQIDLERGRLWAIVPTERAAAATSDLEFDAIRSEAERDALARETTRRLRPLLERTPAKLLAIEHWKAVEDLHAAPAHAFLVGDSEFDYVTASDPNTLVEQLLSAELWFPTVGVIATAPAGVELPGTRELTVGHVEEVVAGLDLILIGAWDADGYVFWEPWGAHTGVQAPLINP